jgi:hypothetical protein
MNPLATNLNQVFDHTNDLWDDFAACVSSSSAAQAPLNTGQ